MTTKPSKMDWIPEQEGTDPLVLSEMEKVGIARLIDKLKGTKFEGKLNVFELAQHTIVSHGDEEETYERLCKADAFHERYGIGSIEQEKLIEWAEEHLGDIEKSYTNGLTNYQSFVYEAKNYKYDKFFKGMVLVKPIPEMVRYYQNFLMHRFKMAMNDLYLLRNGFLFIYDMRGTSARYGPKRYNFDKLGMERSGVFPARMRRLSILVDGIAYKVVKSVMSLPKFVPDKMRERMKIFKSGDQMLEKKYLELAELPISLGGQQNFMSIKESIIKSSKTYAENISKVVLFEPHPHAGPHVDIPETHLADQQSPKPAQEQPAQTESSKPEHNVEAAQQQHENSNKAAQQKDIEVVQQVVDEPIKEPGHENEADNIVKELDSLEFDEAEADEEVVIQVPVATEEVSA